MNDLNRANHCWHSDEQQSNLTVLVSECCLVQISLLVNLVSQHISANCQQGSERNRCSRIKFSLRVKKLCSLGLSRRQGQVKGSYCQCLLMGHAEGSDGGVICVMMMVMVSYRLPGVPQVHTYLWPATSLSQGEHICLTPGPFRRSPKQSHLHLHRGWV